MKKIIILFLVIFLHTSFAYAASSTLAILQQTLIQTAEHLKRLQEAIQTVKLLKEQVEDTQHILDLAVEAAIGVDGVEFVSDFRNVVVETNDLIEEIQVYINSDHNLSKEWGDLFGTLGFWVEEAGEIFENIEMSDSINSRGYTIADSYHEIYKKNSESAQQFIAHAKTVNEKGALKQIAEELGHLIQMENDVIYILSEILRSQSVEYANENLRRKEEVVRFEQENEGVRRFIDLVSTDEFNL